MRGASILIVDDEKNIRLTLSECLESLGFGVETAENGEAALEKLRGNELRVVLLDLRLPGMDGMEVLTKIHEIRPDIEVVIITAHGTIDAAVEAMKLGAADFIQKPFVPQEIRDLVLRVLDREKAAERNEVDYAVAIDLGRKCIEENHLDAAVEHLRRAFFLDHARPEAYNLMGAVMELRRDLDEARRHYRAAVTIDPTFEPGMENLERVTTWHSRGGIVLEQGKTRRKATE